MPIHRIDSDKITPMKRTTFKDQGLWERRDLQPLLKKDIKVISPDTLIVAEEFSPWQDSDCRIDLLGIDKDANLVVIELKRTEKGGHMDLQAIRYTAMLMVSSWTFGKLVLAYKRYLDDNHIEKDAEEDLRDFLDWEGPDDEQLGQDAKIVLASAEFSRELTTSVMWLNDYGELDIRCVRMHPYTNERGETFLDVQTIIPIPEVTDYQVRMREKKQKERESRQNARDFTKYDVSIGGEIYRNEFKRWMIFRVVSGVLRNGGKLQQVVEAIPSKKNHLFEEFEGELDGKQVRDKIMEDDTGGIYPRVNRFFCNDDEIFHVANKTYVLTNQWTGSQALDATRSLAKMFPNLNIEFNPTE